MDMGEDCCDGILWIDCIVNFFWHWVLLRKSINDSTVCILGPPCVVELYHEVVLTLTTPKSKLQVLRAVGLMVNTKREFHPNLYLLGLFTSKNSIRNDAAVKQVSDSLTDMDVFLSELTAEKSRETQESILRMLVLCSVLNGKLHFSDEKNILVKAVEAVGDAELDFVELKTIRHKFCKGDGIAVHDLNMALGFIQDRRLAMMVAAAAGNDSRMSTLDHCMGWVGFILDFLDDPIFCGRGTW